VAATASGIEVAAANGNLVVPKADHRLRGVIDEQIAVASGTSGDMIIRALHLKLLSGEDIVISSARAKIACACED
jgi:hypothetical protein